MDRNSEMKISQDKEVDLYEVDKIINKKITLKGEIFYLVKWVGFDEEDSTWEPVENLQYVTDLIEQYEGRSMDSSNCNGEGQISNMNLLIDQPLSPKQEDTQKNNETLDLFKKSIQNSTNSQMNYDEYIKGNIDYDKPKSINFAKISNGQLYFNVSWEERSDGTTPVDQIIPHMELRQRFPYLLLDFYEQRLRYGNMLISCKKLKEDHTIEAINSIGKDVMSSDLTEN